MSQAILGIQPEYDGLRVAPCLPDWLTEYTVRRRFRGTVYVVHVRRTGTPSMTADGRTVDGNLAPLFPGKEQVTVEVTL
ncbi:MAG: hypothetical protein LUC39_07420 [Clostridiales bacterium]|nr:hypothetical protein [Clostridiales bacterium]